jgi:glucosamine--fructose-6-phosphate aminotransferase (isomerizing)
MLETPKVVANFNFNQAAAAEKSLRKSKAAFFTGEGSSRIFPAKHFIHQVGSTGLPLRVMTQGARQAAECDLASYTVFGASNSGKTKELVLLFRQLQDAGHKGCYSLSAFADTPLGEASSKDGAYVLSCGKEQAVAATKSVVEQALFYHAIVDRLSSKATLPAQVKALSAAMHKALTVDIDAKLIKKLANADILHWAGRNDGVAEELTLKTNEITRKRSAYLEGTYAVHGIEEVMSKKDAVIVIEPFADEEAKFEEVLVKGVGCTVIAISSRKTRFPTIRIPALAGLDPYVRMAAGWNLLVAIGLARKVDLDRTVRARMVGNELAARR